MRQQLYFNAPAVPHYSQQGGDMDEMRLDELNRLQAPQAGYGGGFGGWLTSPEVSQGLIGAGQAILNSGYGGNAAQGIFGFNEGMQKAKQQRIENAYKMLSARSWLGGRGQPASLQLANEYQKAVDAGDIERANNIERFAKTLEKNTERDASGNIVPAAGAAGAVAALSAAKVGAEQNAKNISDFNFKPAIEQKSVLAKTDAERQAGFSKANTALQGFKNQSQIVLKNIKDAQDLINGGWASGYASYLSGLPNTDAGALKDKLETIKANIGFDKLQQMREASPTGGAVGNVSDYENKLLQAVNGALDPKQEKNLNQNLAVIAELYPQLIAEREQAFDRDYGGFRQSSDIPKSRLINSPASGVTKSGHKYTVIK